VHIAGGNDIKETHVKGDTPSVSLAKKIAASAVVIVGLTSLALLAGAGLASTGSSSSAAYQYGKKVTICHHTHSKKHPFVTITVAKAALKAHLKHGDTIGPCSSANSAAAKAKARAKAAAAAKAKAKGKSRGHHQHPPAPSPTGSGNSSSHGNGNGHKKP
jgi:hypothetical protein